MSSCARTPPKIRRPSDRHRICENFYVLEFCSKMAIKVLLKTESFSKRFALMALRKGLGMIFMFFSWISPGNIGCSENCWGHADATQVSGQQQRPRISSRSTKGKPPERYEPGPPSKPSMHKVSSKLPDAFPTLTLA